MTSFVDFYDGEHLLTHIGWAKQWKNIMWYPLKVWKCIFVTKTWKSLSLNFCF